MCAASPPPKNHLGGEGPGVGGPADRLYSLRVRMTRSPNDRSAPPPLAPPRKGEGKRVALVGIIQLGIMFP